MEQTKQVVTLKNGNSMPIVGLGTWQASDEELEKALEAALEAGYRHIDTASVYENEKPIGRVLKRWIDSGKVKRSELFIVTKLPPGGNRPEDVETWIQRSLENLQLSYLDLYLVHCPFAFVKDDDFHPRDEHKNIKIDPTTDHLKVWAEMEKQVEKGRTKAIGLSNFNKKQISRILEHAKVDVSCLQIELHLYFQQKELVKFCADKKIAVTAYSPLGSRGLVNLLGVGDKHPSELENPIVLELAKKYDKTPAQILLKHITEKGIAVIPKSTNPKRLRDNFQLFEWELGSDDMRKLDSLDLGESGRICNFVFLKGVEKHPEFPF